jgi:hypothetical protein
MDQGKHHLGLGIEQPPDRRRDRLAPGHQCIDFGDAQRNHGVPRLFQTRRHRASRIYRHPVLHRPTAKNQTHLCHVIFSQSRRNVCLRHPYITVHSPLMTNGGTRYEMVSLELTD